MSGNKQNYVKDNTNKGNIQIHGNKGKTGSSTVVSQGSYKISK